ncbi:efflux RND transporter permease subunit [Ruminococcus sp. FMB-CY1]|uniref:efflux RND transporter permease subunit n=1 Tax=unclassified Ruminococcus TaxID=2608920 RepID=UPI00208FBFBE|nr:MULTISPECIES: efflux RND transporter permease subunit [unclassified Ruminococcus]USP70488.1 efflux RND transporter permease subunit [Ruminococcus sp. FMBCY1]WBX58342.1 efflux RND transporter permease subunit [Ruminococcus sp. FMB-CY1]
MLPKLSVKKPMTIFVAVIVVIVLGIVSVFKMTPDLLPNMDFPYAIILTTYPGQTPETVESVVTKPLEQSLSTIDGVKTITSTSSDNYSILTLEFEDGTNMDTATVDMRGNLDTIKDAWPDGVGSPYLMKINPNMMPVAMVAVDYDGYDTVQISDYVNNELKNQLEGIDGVASVSTKGIVTQKENVIISQTKIDALNAKINDALNDKFGDAEKKISDAKKELQDNISKAEQGSDTIEQSINDLNSQQEEVAKQLADAHGKAQSGYTEILNAKMQLLDQQQSLTATKQTLTIAYQTLTQIKEKLDSLQDEKAQLTQQIEAFEKIYNDYKDALSKLANPDLTDEQLAQVRAILAKIDEELDKYGFPKEELEERLNNAKNALTNVDKAITQTVEALKGLDTTEEKLDDTIAEIADKISQVDGGITQIAAAVKGLDNNTVSVNQALSEIEKQQSLAAYQLSGGLSALNTKQSEVNSALTQLNSAQEELKSASDELSDQKDKAKKAADMTNTVTISNVSNILTAQNFSMPAGYVSDDENIKYLVRVGDKIDGDKEMQSLALFDTGIDGIGVVKLGDVADVFIADDSDEVFTKINGNSGVVFSFSKQSDAATATVSENIAKKLNSLTQENEGLHFTTLMDQGDYIDIIINSVLQNLLMGAVLAIIILYLFLRDIKPTLIVALSIPISVIFALVLMYFSGVTLNMISLSGLAIGVGMLVDNSVVVIENIYRLRNLGVPPVKAALNGAKQVAGAIASSTLTTICVFFPIVFIEGLTRQIFMDMALTITYSLLASLIVALTLVPAMGQRMLRKVKPVKHGMFDKMLGGYEKSIRFVLKHRAIALIAAVVLLFGSMFGAVARGFSFMPNMASTELSVTVSLDDSATMDDTIDAAQNLLDTLSEYDEFETVGVMTGSTTSLMGLTGSVSSSDADKGSVMAYAVFKDDKVKNSESISKEIEAELQSIDGDVVVSGSSSSSSMSAMLGDDGVSIKLYGDDLKTLQNTAKDMTEKLAAVDGIDETDNGIGATSGEIKVTVDKTKAAKKSLTVAQVYQQIAAAITSETTSSTLTNSGKDLDVVVIKDENSDVTKNNIKDIKLTYTDKEGNEKTTKLSEVAEISDSESMNSITRSDQKRYIKVSGTLKDGYTNTDVSNKAKAVFDDYKLPDGCSIEYSGSNESTMEAVNQMLLMMLLGIILIYLIMVAQFQSLKSPFIIMFTIPLAFTGGFLGLLITGFDVSVVALLGFVMLCGIIVNNGIVLVDYINNLRLEGKERREAIVEAGKTRMRPILITAITTVLGLSTMALGIGTGSEIMQPIAIVCIGGLLYATIMTLYIVPVIYDILSKKELRKVSESDLEEIDI